MNYLQLRNMDDLRGTSYEGKGANILSNWYMTNGACIQNAYKVGSTITIVQMRKLKVQKLAKVMQLTL